MIDIKKECRNCGNAFHAKSRLAIFCSRSCKRKFWIRIGKGSELNKKSCAAYRLRLRLLNPVKDKQEKKQITVPRVPKEIAMSRHEKFCGSCGVSFITSRRNRKYCSNVCREKFSYQKGAARNLNNHKILIYGTANKDEIEIIKRQRAEERKANLVTPEKIAARLSHDKFAEEITKPLSDRELKPLLLYKGSPSPVRMQALYNLAVGMMMSECEDFSEGRKLSSHDDSIHIAGIHRPVELMTIKGIFGRLRDNLNICDRVVGLREYVLNLHPQECIYEKVPEQTYSNRSGVWWRTEIKKKRLPKIRYPEISPMDLAYPFVRHDCSHAHMGQDMVAKVHEAVPKMLPHSIRADICQDVIVAVLNGEIEIENLKNEIKPFISRNFKLWPGRYGIVSLDAPMHELEGKTLHDVLSSQAYRDINGDDHYFDENGKISLSF